MSYCNSFEKLKSKSKFQLEISSEMRNVHVCMPTRKNKINVMLLDSLEKFITTFLVRFQGHLSNGVLGEVLEILGTRRI